MPFATAGLIFHIFGAIEQHLGVIEEAALVAKAEEDADVKKHLTQAKEWFEYMSNNDGTTPSQKPTSKHKSLDDTKREKYLGMQMAMWRVGNNGGPKQLQRNLYLVVLRDFETFAAFCYGQKEKSTKPPPTSTRCSSSATLPPRSASSTRTCCTSRRRASRASSITKEHNMWSHYLGGQGEDNEEALLANLPPKRVTTAKEMHNGRFEARKAKKAESSKKRKEAAHASGLVTPRAKKAKTSSRRGAAAAAARAQ